MRNHSKLGVLVGVRTCFRTNIGAGLVLRGVILLLMGSCGDDQSEVPQIQQPYADVNTLDSSLVDAAEEGNAIGIKDVLQRYHDQKVERKNRKAFSLAIIGSITGDHLDAMRILIEEGGVNCRLLWLPIDAPVATGHSPEDGLTPLMVAASHGNPVVVHELLRLGANVELKARGGITALQLAKDAGYDGIVELLQSGRLSEEK